MGNSEKGNNLDVIGGGGGGGCFKRKKAFVKRSLQGAETVYFSWQPWRKPALLSFRLVWVDTNRKISG